MACYYLHREAGGHGTSNDDDTIESVSDHGVHVERIEGTKTTSVVDGYISTDALFKLFGIIRPFSYIGIRSEKVLHLNEFLHEHPITPT